MTTAVNAIDNKKGGVGKTTVAENLGTALAALFGERVLLVDLDSDRCLTDGVAGGTFDAHAVGKLTILDVLANPTQGFSDAIIPYDLARFAGVVPQLAALLTDFTVRAGGKVDLVAGSEDLADAPALFLSQTVQQPVGTFDQVLPWLVRHPDITSTYDRIILDIGPGWDKVTRSGLFAADKAIIPVEPASLSIEAFKRHQMRIGRANSERARAGIAGRTEVGGVLVSRVDLRSEVQVQIAAALRTALERGGVKCYQTQIPTSDAILVAMKDHLPAWAAYPDDPGAQAFIHLAHEVALAA